jgi:predicted pyridoxine 5'-phosphate oxidase superfamily flavin-nucleotide-binding protein
LSFHADELAAQARAGVGARSLGIRELMPEQHRAFFAALPQLYVATADATGWPLATLVEGEPGFVASPAPDSLRVHSLPVADDPACGTIREGQEVGLLGIDLATRRRNRANGVIAAADGAAFTLAVRQSFGNCPQYIQRRTLSRAQTASGPVRSLDSLDDEVRALIARADTFFVASRSRSGVGPDGGADISHRGGRPGFVRVEGDRLSIPDFRGNRYFNTLGNLLGEPRSSLLFLDFETGNVLQLQGIATVDWSAPAAAQLEGAERLWHFRVERGWFRPRASALRASFVDYSPVTLRTGTWQSEPEIGHARAGAR